MAERIQALLQINIVLGILIMCRSSIHLHLMKTIFYSFIAAIAILSCDTAKKESGSECVSNPTHNISTKMLVAMEWLNALTSTELKDSTLWVTVSQGTDFFNNPEDGSIVRSAPFLHQRMQGDFVAKALVQPDFNSQWNAVALMVYLDSLNWIKFGFENSDATGPSIVSVVTKGSSDDANGVVSNDQEQLWLAIAKKDNNYSMHWSKDGKAFYMTRLTSMPEADTIQVGVEFQSPVGETATHTLHFFEVSNQSLENLRILK